MSSLDTTLRRKIRNVNTADRCPVRVASVDQSGNLGPVALWM